MDGLNYWWQRFEKIKTMLSVYRKINKLTTVEECIEHLLENNIGKTL